jgi:hypothetical protein
LVPILGAPVAKGVLEEGGTVMKTLVIGLVITIVFLATYWVSAMQRIW